MLRSVALPGRNQLCAVELSPLGLGLTYIDVTTLVGLLAALVGGEDLTILKVPGNNAM